MFLEQQELVSEREEMVNSARGGVFLPNSNQAVIPSIDSISRGVASVLDFDVPDRKSVSSAEPDSAKPTLEEFLTGNRNLIYKAMQVAGLRTDAQQEEYMSTALLAAHQAIESHTDGMGELLTTRVYRMVWQRVLDQLRVNSPALRDPFGIEDALEQIRQREEKNIPRDQLLTDMELREQVLVIVNADAQEDETIGHQAIVNFCERKLQNSTVEIEQFRDSTPAEEGGSRLSSDQEESETSSFLHPLPTLIERVRDVELREILKSSLLLNKKNTEIAPIFDVSPARVSQLITTGRTLLLALDQGAELDAVDDQKRTLERRLAITELLAKDSLLSSKGIRARLLERHFFPSHDQLRSDLEFLRDQGLIQRSETEKCFGLSEKLDEDIGHLAKMFIRPGNPVLECEAQGEALQLSFKGEDLLHASIGEDENMSTCRIFVKMMVACVWQESLPRSSPVLVLGVKQWVDQLYEVRENMILDMPVSEWLEHHDLREHFPEITTNHIKQYLRIADCREVSASESRSPSTVEDLLHFLENGINERKVRNDKRKIFLKWVRTELAHDGFVAGHEVTEDESVIIDNFRPLVEQFMRVANVKDVNELNSSTPPSSAVAEVGFGDSPISVKWHTFLMTIFRVTTGNKDAIGKNHTAYALDVIRR